LSIDITYGSDLFGDSSCHTCYASTSYHAYNYGSDGEFRVRIAAVSVLFLIIKSSTSSSSSLLLIIIRDNLIINLTKMQSIWALDIESNDSKSTKSQACATALAHILAAVKVNDRTSKLKVVYLYDILAMIKIV
jgi:hypothetical protein